MSLIFVILGILLGLHLGYKGVYIIMVNTSGYYNDKPRLVMSLCGFIAIFILTTWLTVTALTVIFGI